MIGCRGWPAGLLFLLSAALILGLYLTRDWALPGLAKWLNVARPHSRVPSEYLMILGGDNRFRPAVAASLWKSGYVGQILLPPQPVSEDHPHRAESRSANAPDGQAGLTGLRRSAGRNQQRSIGMYPAPIRRRRPWASSCNRSPRRVIVVTSDFHTRRASMGFPASAGSRGACEDVCFVSRAARPTGFTRKAGGSRPRRPPRSAWSI